MILTGAAGFQWVVAGVSFTAEVQPSGTGLFVGDTCRAAQKPITAMRMEVDPVLPVLARVLYKRSSMYSEFLRDHGQSFLTPMDSQPSSTVQKVWQ